MAIDKSLVNVILLGFGFLFVFTAFQTMGNIEKIVLDSISHDDPDFKGDGYTSLAVIYIVFAVCNWLAPSIISLTGPRIAMLLGGITYMMFITSFLLPKTWLLYAASVLIGAGAAIMWTGQGNYLTLNSTSTTMTRNSGIFWALMQASMFFGNLYVYFKFQGLTHIDLDTRTLVFWVLIATAIVGMVFLLALRPPPSTIPVTAAQVSAEQGGPVEALKNAGKLFFTRDMLLLSLTFFYTGIELSFFSGVYSPSIGFTEQFGSNAKQLVGLSGIMIGVGEVIGGAVFGIFGSKTSKWGRDPIVISGFVLHLASFILIFLNLPDNAPFGNTKDEAFITSSAALAIFCSFLLGLGDSFFNTQIYSILGVVFSSNSAPAFAIFKFTQSSAAGISFFYASHLGLYYQLLILLIFSVAGTFTFCLVEWKVKKSGKSIEAEKDLVPTMVSNTDNSQD